MRRFERGDINDLKRGMWGMRREAWKKLSRKKRRWASLDLDSKICPIYGNKKESTEPTETNLAAAVASAEKKCILNALEMTKGNKTEAAEVLGISRKNLWEKMKQYHL